MCRPETAFLYRKATHDYPKTKRSNGLLHNRYCDDTGSFILAGEQDNDGRDAGRHSSLGEGAVNTEAFYAAEQVMAQALAWYQNNTPTYSSGTSSVYTSTDSG